MEKYQNGMYNKNPNKARNTKLLSQPWEGGVGGLLSFKPPWST